jgi:DNA helicase-4
VASLAGVATHDAASFISSANAAFRAHILGQFEAVKDELSALSEAIVPRQHP